MVEKYILKHEEIPEPGSELPLLVSSHLFKKIKRKAKSIRLKDHELSKQESLEIASNEILKIGYEKTKSEHLVYNLVHSGNYVTCSYCHEFFDYTNKKHRKRHKRAHRQREKAEYYLGYRIGPYENRVISVKNTRYFIDNTSDMDLKISYLIKHIKNHFYNSMERAIIDGYYKEHPNVDEYIAMFDYENFLPKDGVEKMKEKYGKIPSYLLNNAPLKFWMPVEIKHHS